MQLTTKTHWWLGEALGAIVATDYAVSFALRIAAIQSVLRCMKDYNRRVFVNETTQGRQTYASATLIAKS